MLSSAIASKLPCANASLPESLAPAVQWTVQLVDHSTMLVMAAEQPGPTVDLCSLTSWLLDVGGRQSRDGMLRYAVLHLQHADRDRGLVQRWPWILSTMSTLLATLHLSLKHSAVHNIRQHCCPAARGARMQPHFTWTWANAARSHSSQTGKKCKKDTE